MVPSTFIQLLRAFSVLQFRFSGRTHTIGSLYCQRWLSWGLKQSQPGLGIGSGRIKSFSLSGNGKAFTLSSRGPGCRWLLINARQKLCRAGGFASCSSTRLCRSLRAWAYGWGSRPGTGSFTSTCNAMRSTFAKSSNTSACSSSSEAWLLSGHCSRAVWSRWKRRLYPDQQESPWWEQTKDAPLRINSTARGKSRSKCSRLVCVRVGITEDLPSAFRQELGSTPWDKSSCVAFKQKLPISAASSAVASRASVTTNTSKDKAVSPSKEAAFTSAPAEKFKFNSNNEPIWQ